MKKITQQQFEHLRDNASLYGKEFCKNWGKGGFILSKFPYIGEDSITRSIYGMDRVKNSISFKVFISNFENPVQQVQNGKLAVENDDKESTIKVLNHCFPKHDSTKQFNYDFYYKCETFKEEYNHGNLIDIPTIKATELLKFIECMEDEPKFKFVKGEIYVRTVGVANSLEHGISKGDIVIALEDNEKECVYATKFSNKNFRPATAKEVQAYKDGIRNINQIKDDVEEWSLGTYAVAIKGCYGVFKKGDTNDQNSPLPLLTPLTIENQDSDSITVKEGKSYWIYKENCKWFATKQEAEDYIVSQTKPVSLDPNTVIHCKTFEEFINIIKLIGHPWDDLNRVWNDTKQDTCLRISDNTICKYDTVDYYKKQGCNIVSVKQVINQINKKEDGNKENIKTNDSLVRDSREERRESIKIRTVSSRDFCQRGSITSSNRNSKTRRNSSRIRATSGKHFIKKR